MYEHPPTHPPNASFSTIPSIELCPIFSPCPSQGMKHGPQVCLSSLHLRIHDPQTGNACLLPQLQPHARTCVPPAGKPPAVAHGPAAAGGRPRPPGLYTGPHSASDAGTGCQQRMPCGPPEGPARQCHNPSQPLIVQTRLTTIGPSQSIPVKPKNSNS